MRTAVLSCAFLSILTMPALAHARLVRSSPAAQADVTAPADIVLTFSEALEPAFSGAMLLDRDGHNVTGGPVKIDDRVMTLTPGHLAPGTYRVDWHSVGQDTHRLEGHFTFTVRP